MTRVVVVGCGVVGAAIAYELSQVPGLTITVLEQQQPAQGSTGAALGVLMGAISQKVKGNNLRMRLASIQRYDTWIPELEAVTGQSILYNRQGILRLCFDASELDFWRSLVDIRQKQGWRLNLCDRTELIANYPHINLERVVGAVYSPQDRQVDPAALTRALVAGAQKNGVTFHFNERVLAAGTATTGNGQQCLTVETETRTFPVDWLVIAAGLGSTPLTAHLRSPVEVRPVLGQAVQLKLSTALGHPHHQPMITGEDTHIVPLGQGEYWVGATVEGVGLATAPAPDAAALDDVMQRAIALCPALADGTRIRTWSGLRPRPEGRPAPIIEKLAGYENVLLATGHYRNGILLAPATSDRIRQMITDAT